MARWTRSGVMVVGGTLAVGLLPATGWAADDLLVGSIAQEKDQIPTAHAPEPGRGRAQPQRRLRPRDDVDVTGQAHRWRRRPVDYRWMFA
ncbi:MAG: hypothetical protein U0R27_01455 [Candidatus Nanopelagicales bacterium]